MTTLAAKLGIGFALGLALLAAALYWYALHLPGRNHTGPTPPLDAAGQALAQRLRGHVTAIASVPHNVRHHAALQRAAAYIERELAAIGLAPERHPYHAHGQVVANIEATIAPAGSGPPRPSLVVGAHYDSAGDAPGANDNGTGVAALIEIARSLMAGPAPARPIRLVFFVNEEPPYFDTDLMGSRKYAAMLENRGEAVAGMLSLETLGAYSDAPGSQRYPKPFALFLPDRADFVAFVAMPGSRRFLHDVVGSFRRHTPIPTVGGVAPERVPGIAWSDHASFASRGIPAVMITDTALFRYRHYHTPEDTPDKVAYDKLALVTSGLAAAVRDLAN